jgi:hypothetical protein
MRRVHGPQPKSHELMLDTYNQMEKTAHRYARLGYRYIIGWRDVRGYGVFALHFADWQTPESSAYINLRLS